MQSLSSKLQILLKVTTPSVKYVGVTRKVDSDLQKWNLDVITELYYSHKSFAYLVIWGKSLTPIAFQFWDKSQRHYLKLYEDVSQWKSHIFPVNIYPLKVNNKNTRKKSEICSEITIKTPKWRHWRRSGSFIVNFEQISYLFLVFLLLTLST